MNAAFGRAVLTQSVETVRTARKPIVLRPGERARQLDTPDTRSLLRANGERLWYRVNADGTAVLTGYDSALAQIVVPERIGGHEVVSLATGAFADLPALRSLRCPSTLRDIESYAFSRCAHLNEVELNEGLESIEHAAFYLCGKLETVRVPSTLSHVGSRPFGDIVYGRESRTGRLEVPASHQHLRVDDAGALYERLEAGGWRLVDASGVSASEFEPLPGTVEVGDSAFLGNIRIRSFCAGPGIERIGRDAFRGCAHLSRVQLPEKLERICTGAFSRSAVRHLCIPASCVALEEDALCTGPVFKGSTGRPYSSDLASIEVDRENRRYFSRGGALFERESADGAAGAERLVLCPKTLAELDLSRTERIGPGALAGIEHIGRLSLREDIAGYGFVHFGCDSLHIDLSRSHGGTGAVELEMPSGKAGTALMGCLFAPGGLQVEAFLLAFDEALCELMKTDKIEASRLMVHRCASPLLLGERHEKLFRGFLSANIQSVAVHFGARGYWQGLDLLDQTGLLNAGNVSGVADVLARCCGSLAVSHVLELAHGAQAPGESLSARIEDAYAL